MASAKATIKTATRCRMLGSLLRPRFRFTESCATDGQLLRRNAWFSRSDIEAREGVAPEKSDCRYGVKRNGSPHTAHLSKLESDVAVADPYRGALGGHSLNSSNSGRFLIYPDLSKYQTFLFALRDDVQYLLGHDAEVFLPKENEVVIRPADISTVILCRRFGFLLQKSAHDFLHPWVSARMGDRRRAGFCCSACSKDSESDSDLGASFSFSP
jgi:hypothetical protein